MISGPNGYYTVGRALVDAVAGVVTGMNRVGMVPGIIAWDQCECGMLAGSVGRIWPTENFPEVSKVTQCSGGTLAGEITLQVLRCSAIGNGDDMAPSASQLDTEALTVTQDGWRLLETVMCTLAGLEDEGSILGFLTRQVVFAGPMGLCVGPQLTVVVELHHGRDV